MTQISRDDVVKLATMSSLQLRDDDVDALVRDIDSVLSYVAQLDELDTDDVVPTYQVNDLSNVWRDDVSEESLSHEQLLALAPEQLDGQIKVPKVL